MKKTNENLILLNIIFVISIVIANVVGCKIFNTGIYIGKYELAMSGGALTYAFTFLCTDIIGEIWGKKEAGMAVLYGIAGQLFAIFLIIATQYLHTNDQAMQDAYVTLLGQSPMFVVGSITAYFCSQKWDVFIFHKIREKWLSKHGNNKARWIWNNASTITSQAIDTLVYATISFGIGCGFFEMEGGFDLWMGIVLGQYLLKALMALLDTPIFYLLTKKTKEFA